MHQALYRKYRPQTFDDVIGQQAVTQTLKNQVKSGSFVHAYLFTGTRGTGKTTCARLLAKAVNCLDMKEGNPCNECDICRGLSDGSITDITEIDAATNTGVESVRQLLESVEFVPVCARYKVYVIDEVHMLSDSAYNALLKTIEEPPAYVIFILATTEVNKVPATILSRCQRFDFRRVSAAEIAQRIKQILAAEQKVMDEESIELVAELADGSVRDALSILEKVIDFDNIQAVRDVLGVIGKEAIYNLVESAADADIGKIYTGIADLYSNSKDMSVLCTELLSCFRSLLIIQNVKEYERILDVGQQDGQRLKNLAEKYSQDRVLYAMQQLQNTIQFLSRSSDKRADVELCLLKIAVPAVSGDYDALAARMDALEQKWDSGAVNLPSETIRSASHAESVESPIQQYKTNSSDKQTVVRVATPSQPETSTEVKKVQVPTAAELFGNDAFAGAPSVPASDAEEVAAKESHTMSEVGAPAAQPGQSGYHEFLSWSDVCALVCEKDMFLGMSLKNSCVAVYRNTELVVLCSDPYLAAEVCVPGTSDLIRDALEKMRKTGYTVQVKPGRKSDYIGSSDTYDHIEDNPMFDFE